MSSPAKRFAKLQAAQSRPAFEPATLDGIPAWLQRMIPDDDDDAKVRPAQLVKAVLEHVAADPTEATLREAQALLTELSRTEEFAVATKKAVTNAFVGRLRSPERPEKS